MCCFMNVGLFEAQESDQNCLRSSAKDHVESQTQGVMKPVEMLFFQWAEIHSVAI